MRQVDMSPKAVTRRLERLDQIWYLSVSLMKAGREAREKSKENNGKKNDRNEQK
jgi:hypothetical protein